MDAEDASMDVQLSEHAILWNLAALNALKRPQLVSLAKKYDLRATGKNTDMVARLNEFGQTLLEEDGDKPDSPRSVAQLHPAPRALQQQASRTTLSRGSDAWEMLSDANASMVVVEDDSEHDGRFGSSRSWKSAGNGESLNEFGPSDSSRTISSLRSLTRSIKRNSLSLLSNRSTSSRSMPTDVDPAPCHAEEAPVKAVPQPAESAEEEMLDQPPSSPASTAGVPKRHRSMTLNHRPSTMRLVVSPAPSEQDDLPLPLANLPMLKQRRSMAPLGNVSPAASAALNRRSMPALSPTGIRESASVPSIYPTLPPPVSASTYTSTLAARHPFDPVPEVDASVLDSTASPPQASLAIPGAFPHVLRSPPSTSSFVFGQDTATSAQFDDVAQQLMREMAAKTGISFDAELLKGRNAEVGKLVAINAEVGRGADGWGLASSSSATDRYAESHQREFARMKSLSSLKGPSRQASSSTLATSKRKHDDATVSAPSAPNGLPLASSTCNEDDRQTKRKKMSAAPSLIARSIRSKLATPRKKLASQHDSKQRGFLRRSPIKDTHERPTGLGESLRRSGTAVRRVSVDLSTAIFRLPGTPGKDLAEDSEATVQVKKERARLPIPDFGCVSNASTGGSPKSTASSLVRSTTTASFARPTLSSSRTTASLAQSTASSRTQSSMPPSSLSTASLAASGRSTSTASTASSRWGLPKQHEISTATAVRKASRAELISTARPAPAPPKPRMGSTVSFAATPSGEGARAPAMPRSTSTLYAPTASSLARMQATAKPAASRPLPKVPPATQARAPVSPIVSLPIANLYGAAASRDDRFETNFNLAPPAPLSPLRQIAAPNTLAPPSSPFNFLSDDPAASNAASRAPLTPPGSTPAKLKSKPSERALPGGPRTPHAGKALAPQGSAARLRHKASGASAIKSRGDLRGEADVARRRAEMRAKQERIAQEKDLRAMLG